MVIKPLTAGEVDPRRLTPPGLWLHSGRNCAELEPTRIDGIALKADGTRENGGPPRKSGLRSFCDLPDHAPRCAPKDLTVCPADNNCRLNRTESSQLTRKGYPPQISSGSEMLIER